MKGVKTIAWFAGVIIVAAFCSQLFAEGKGEVGVEGDKLKLDAAMSHPLMLVGKKQTAYLRVGLRGFTLESEKQRAAVNIAVVIDKSGSMSGEKIRDAKEAAIMAIQRLTSRDILSVVVYDSTVHVLVPATKVSDKDIIIQKIRGIEAGGTTALFGGVSKGASEMRKFLSEEMVNRLVLLSDGMANIGPRTPGELGELGASLIKDGISVTTIGLGLGYNEDLMTKLAYESDGSHHFAEESGELKGIFEREFGKALSVVAQEIEIEIKCPEGVRPVRVLGREADIVGQNVSVLINQLYSGYQKYAILEVEVASGTSAEIRRFVEVDVKYANMKTRSAETLESRVRIGFSDSQEIVDKSVNKNVMIDVVELIAADRNELAMQLRDKGQVKEAQAVFNSNATYLKDNAKQYDSKKLEEYGVLNGQDANNLGEKSYLRQRKVMREEQVMRRAQER